MTSKPVPPGTPGRAVAGTGAPWPPRPAGPSGPGGPPGPGRLMPPAPSFAGHLPPVRRSPSPTGVGTVATPGGPGFSLPQPSGPPRFDRRPGLSWLPALMAPTLLLAAEIAYVAWAAGWA